MSRATSHRGWRRDASLRAQQRSRLAEEARRWSDVAMASVFEKHGKYYARWKDAVEEQAATRNWSSRLRASRQ